MRTITTIAYLILLILLGSSNGLAQSKSTNQLIIRVSDDEGWGNADVEDIESVLYSAANEILKYVPNNRLKTIKVKYDKDRPVTPYRKDPNGKFTIHLAAKGDSWAQLVYQFSHELAHVLARGESGKEKESPNQWFEESICMTASLFTLRRMSETWKTSPYPNWKSFAPSLRKYADNQMSKQSRQLPNDMTLAQWYKKNESNLKSEDVSASEARNKQFIIASKLLPIFEKSPSLWESVSYLDVKKSDSSYFQNYMNNWHTSAPEKHRQLIQDINYMFKE
jgi:hypothetical protein